MTLENPFRATGLHPEDTSLHHQRTASWQLGLFLFVHIGGGKKISCLPAERPGVSRPVLPSAASLRQNADGIPSAPPSAPSAPRLPLTARCPHSACPPQQPEQRQQQRLAVQRLPLPFPQLALPLPQLQPGPAGARAALQRVLPRLRLHIAGRLPVQVAIPHAAGGPQPGKGACPGCRGRRRTSAWRLPSSTGETSGLISHL